MDPLVWILLLLGGALVVAVLEVFVPSGGVLGVVAIGLLLAAILMIGFSYGPTMGVAAFVASALVLPIIIAWFIRWWPNSPMGRRILPEIRGDDVLPEDAQREGLKQLLGKVGRAKTVMLPSGAAVIEGRTVNAISEGMPIEAGQLVRVVDVRGRRIVVRATDEEPETAAKADDDLSRPIDSLGLDPLDDPFGET